MTPLELLAENEEWLALNKPAGLLSIPDREGKEISLKTLLQKTYGSVFTVHRLDKDTSGILLFARNEDMHRYLSSLFENRLAEKWYWGLVKGLPQPATLLHRALQRDRKPPGRSTIARTRHAIRNRDQSRHLSLPVALFPKRS